jgi:hypothetical protein
VDDDGQSMHLTKLGEKKAPAPDTMSSISGSNKSSRGEMKKDRKREKQRVHIRRPNI